MYGPYCHFSKLDSKNILDIMLMWYLPAFFHVPLANFLFNAVSPYSPIIAEISKIEIRHTLSAKTISAINLMTFLKKVQEGYLQFRRRRGGTRYPIAPEISKIGKNPKKHKQITAENIS